MGFLSSAWKSVKKAVKSVAKKVKKVGSQVWGGIKKVVGKVGELFGKLGPLGTIALSFVMPGIGSMLSGMWTSAAGSLASGSFGSVLQAVGQGMQTAATWASKAKGFIANAASPITSKIQSGLEFIGGKVSDGANAIFKGAQELTTGTKNPASIGDLGKWVAEKAKSIVGTNKPTDLTAKALENNPEFLKMANSQSTLAQPVSAQDLITKQADFIGDAAKNTVQFGVDENPELVKMANASGREATTLADNQASFLSNREEGLNSLAGTTSTSNGLLERIAKAGASAFASTPGQLQSALPQFSSGSVPDLTQSTRFGVGGQGSSGGQFLSDAQRQQQSLMAQILGQIG